MSPGLDPYFGSGGERNYFKEKKEIIFFFRKKSKNKHQRASFPLFDTVYQHLFFYFLLFRKKSLIKPSNYLLGQKGFEWSEAKQPYQKFKIKKIPRHLILDM